MGMPIFCYHCKAPMQGVASGESPRITFRETCPSCHADLHVCLNCEFYDESSHHECRESQAEWVRKKDTRNTCEYFRLKPQDLAGAGVGHDSKQKAWADLDSLFKK